MSTLKRVFETRRNAQEELRGLYDANPGELSADAKATEERLLSTIKTMEERELHLIAMAEDEKRAVEAASNSGASAPDAPKAEVRAGSDADSEFRALIEGKRDTVELRDLTKGTPTDGAELVPTTLYGRIHELIVEESQITGMANVLRTAGGEDLVFPRVTAHSAASLISEGGSVGESDPQFDTVTMGAFKLGFAVQVSSELEQDASFDVGSYVIAQGGRALGRGLNAYFVSGTGSSQPTGIDTATTGMTTAATGAVTMDELIEAQHSVLAPQRGRAVWMLSDATIEAVRKLKDNDANYIWQPSNQAGVPSLLLGRPIYSDPNLSDMGAANTFGVFGDPTGFYIRFAGPVRVDRSVEAGFMNDLVTYRFLVRADSEIVDTTGIRKLVNAAA